MQSAVTVALLLLLSSASAQSINSALASCSSQTTYYDSTQYSCQACTPNTN